jgi:hypothetical protein
MPTNVPAPSLSDAGFVAPAEADILAGVFADLQAAFGGALNQQLGTPQGQLASSLAAIIGATNDQFLNITNQVDPAFADGRMQDAIARIYFLTRLPPLSTQVTAVATGAPGTLIPVGSLAQTTSGVTFQSLGDAVIGTGGTVSIPFAAIDTGPIACPAESLNRVLRAVPGWDAVLNPLPGTPGRDVESRFDFEQRRQASVAVNAVGILPAIRAAVLNVPDVLDAYVTENSGAATRTSAGVDLPPHSLYVCAYGGTDADVARAIWAKKNPGCDYFGNTTVTVLDTDSGYGTPYPSYDVTFQRPTALPVQVYVTLANSTAVPADAGAQIQTVVQAAFNGQDGGPRARIGATIYSSRFYSGIAALGAWAQIIDISLTGQAAILSVDMDQVPVLDSVVTSLA